MVKEQRRRLYYITEPQHGNRHGGLGLCNHTGTVMDWWEYHTRTMSTFISSFFGKIIFSHVAVSMVREHDTPPTPPTIPPPHTPQAKTDPFRSTQLALFIILRSFPQLTTTSCISRHSFTPGPSFFHAHVYTSFHSLSLKTPIHSHSVS